MASALTAKQKKKALKTVHQKVKLFRAKEPLLSIFMWGINHSINELNHISVPVMLMPDDFKASSKIKVDNHLFNKENMPSRFKFKEYCPAVFRNLRERFNVDDDSYMNSLNKKSPKDIESPGRSGARFLESYDKRYVIKTLVSEEVAEMHRILNNYHQHIVLVHAETLLPQYLGMYRVTVNDTETYLIVMRNILSPRLTIHKKYDLKGSTVARQASDKEKAKDLPTYKDNDFMNDNTKILIGQEAKVALVKKIEADVEFLTTLKLMDYSLLVGIHDVEAATEEDLNTSVDSEANGGAVSQEDEEDSADSCAAAATPPDSPVGLGIIHPFSGEPDPELEQFAIKSAPTCPRPLIYFVALIDILTHYGMKKRTAQAAKTVKHGAGAEISTVKPEQYAKRFLEFVLKAIE